MRASNYTPVDAVKKLHEELDKLFAGKTFSGQGKNKPLNIFDFEFPTDFGNDEDVDTVAAAAPFILVKAAGWSIDKIIYIVEPHERSPAYIAAAPSGMATSCTVKVPGRIKPREIGAKAYVAGAVGRSKMQVAVALPGAVEAKAVKARAFTAGTVERSHTAINIVIGGQTT